MSALKNGLGNLEFCFPTLPLSLLPFFLRIIIPRNRTCLFGWLCIALRGWADAHPPGEHCVQRRGQPAPKSSSYTLLPGWSETKDDQEGISKWRKKINMWTCFREKITEQMYWQISGLLACLWDCDEMLFACLLNWWKRGFELSNSCINILSFV